MKYASENTKKFTGVSVKTFPKEVDTGEIIDFLVKAGLPESKTDNVTISSRGTATVRDLENSECLLLIDAIHGKRNFERKLFCNGIVPLTPDKSAPEILVSAPALGQQPDPRQVQVGDHTVHQNLPQCCPDQAEGPAVEPLPHQSSEIKTPPTQVPLCPSTSITHFQASEISSFPTSPDLVRRHSLSLTDRTPPHESLAADILGKDRTSLAVKSILASISDMQETLSDFNSCAESLGEGSDSSADEEVENLKSVENIISRSLNDKKRERKAKRKLALTPGKHQFLKKPNTYTSPN